MKLLYIIFGIFIVSCSADKGQQEKQMDNDFVSTKDSKHINQELNSIETIEKIDTLGISNYWKNNKITSATLHAYAPEYTQEGSHANIMNKNEELDYCIIDSLSTELDSNSIDKIYNALLYETTYNEVASDCFMPHHGIIFYDIDDNIIGHISICFECNTYVFKPNRINYVPITIFKQIVMKNKLPIKGHVIRELFKNTEKYSKLEINTHKE
jgi:hypothetical protein